MFRAMIQGSDRLVANSSIASMENHYDTIVKENGNIDAPIYALSLSQGQSLWS